MEKVRIVVAWVVEESVYDGRPYARDLGGRPGMRIERVGRACMWLNEGTKSDVRKAREYAESETSRSATDPSAARHVFVYPLSEQEPLERARREVLTKKARTKKAVTA